MGGAQEVWRWSLVPSLSLILIPFSLSSFSQPPADYIHHLAISATPRIWASVYILFSLLCLHTASMKVFKKSLLGNVRSRIDLEIYSQFTAKWNWLTIRETSLIGLRSETKWWLYNSAPDACVVTEECTWQYSFFSSKNTCFPVCGHFLWCSKGLKQNVVLALTYLHLT